MNSFLKISTLLILALTAGFVDSKFDDENINAITDRTKFSISQVKKKMTQVKAVEEESILGEWEILTSLFTISFEDGGTGNSTFGIEGQSLIIEAEGKFTTRNGKPGRWSLTEGNTVFNELRDGEVYESHRVRVVGDTMEWIAPVGENDFIYFVLAKK